MPNNILTVLSAEKLKADGADCFERYDPVSTGPNLMPWCEMVYYHQFGDMERLHKVFPVLCSYYKWLRLNQYMA